MARNFPRLSANKRRKVLLRQVKKSVGMFELFEKGDRIIIGVSGGCDSLIMTEILADKSSWWSGSVEFFPAHIDPGFSVDEKRISALSKRIGNLGYDLEIVRAHNIARTALGEDKPQNPCFICSRMRRKALLETAEKLKANKVALGHHREDVLETFLINLFWGREIAAMNPNQELFKGKYHIVRPIFLARESQIKKYAEIISLPDYSPDCPVAGKTKRDYVKKLLTRLERENPGLKRNMFRALFHPKPDYLLERYRKE